MKTIEDLSSDEKAALEELKSRILQEFPGWVFRMTLFGSRARGDAERDSDMDVFFEVEEEHVEFKDRQKLRRVTGEVSMKYNIIVSLCLVDRHTRRKRSGFSVFRTIQEEGIPV